VDQDRRRHERKDHKAPVGLMMAAGTLEGHTVNISKDGLLLRGRADIMVTVKIADKEYEGRLVRVTPIDDETCAYAIQLRKPLEGEPEL